MLSEDELMKVSALLRQVSSLTGYEVRLLLDPQDHAAVVGIILGLNDVLEGEFVLGEVIFTLETSRSH